MIEPGTKTCPEKYVYYFIKIIFSTLTLSGKSSKVVLTASLEPNLGALYLLTMSDRVAETMKYCCFSRSSFPSKNCKDNKVNSVLKN